MQNNLSMALTVGGLTMLVAGCSDNHYRVTDPTSGNAYYTTKVSDAGKGGAVKIKDEKTGSIVTLQSSEVTAIPEEEYEAGLVAKAPTKPAPRQPTSSDLPAAQAQPVHPTPIPRAPQTVPAQTPSLAGDQK